MRDWLADVLRQRPWWMNLLLGFCVFMTVAYIPWELFMKPVAEDREVWFGLMLHGWAAKVGGVLHWIVYATATYGFLHMRSWMWPWAAAYAAQVAGGMFVWTVFALEWPQGAVAAAPVSIPFVVLAVLLWNSRPRFLRGHASLKDRYGSWALVTGASAGIGREFALGLARNGVSSVIVARREEELTHLAREIEERYGVEARVIAADLTDPEGIAAIDRATADLDLGIIINNAGFGYVGRLDKQDPARLEEMVVVNCLVPLTLTLRFIRQLTARRRGALIYLSSIAGRTPLPLHAVYSATKAFSEFLGKSLWAELRPLGVDVLVVQPGPVETEFQKIAGEVRAGAAVTPRAIVEAAFDALGHGPVVVPGLGLRVGSWFARVLPAPLVLYLTKRTTSRMTPRDMR